MRLRYNLGVAWERLLIIVLQTSASEGSVKVGVACKKFIQLAACHLGKQSCVTQTTKSKKVYMYLRRNWFAFTLGEIPKFNHDVTLICSRVSLPVHL